MTAGPLIELAGLDVGFTGRDGRTHRVLRGIDLAVSSGESVGIVGESGSGKSTLVLAAMGYLKRGLGVLAGSAHFRDVDLFAAAREDVRAIRGGRLALIPQNSGQALTPNLRIGAQVAESLRLHSPLPRHAHEARVLELLRQVRLPDPPAIARRYPHELSGGQQQRVAIAIGLAGEPEALLLDEPTTGLDVTTQAHILELLSELATRARMAMLYVSHDLGAIARVCNRVVVMYGGEIVADGDAHGVLTAPSHPYAAGLLASIPRLSQARMPGALEGRPPAIGDTAAGCAYAPRCTIAAARCRIEHPALRPVAGAGLVRCHLPERVGAVTLEGGRARVPAVADTATPLLVLDGVAIRYARPGLLNRLQGRPAPVPTVEAIDIAVTPGETLGLVGESGSGKSTILKAIAGLVAPVAGRIALGDDQPLAATVERRAPGELRDIQLIFQNPDESLNPRHTVAEILAQPLMLYLDLSGAELRARSAALLERVRLGADYLDRLPGQLSGGEKQRVAIARAFAAEPRLVLCDEVTSALDVSVQAAVLDLLDTLRRERGTTYVFVSHDLAVVRAVADRVAVLYQGRLCEIGPTAAVFSSPCHPYTEALRGAALEPVPGARPVLLAEDVTEHAPPAQGCPFQRRCHRKLGNLCETTAPPARNAGGGHRIHCHIALEELARVQARPSGGEA
jgi:peptide/nickel transport system ATP-binding protein